MRHEIKRDIGELEFELLADIDNQAERVRGLFITNTASQPSVYLQKEQEAEALMANLEIGEGETPNITREAARTGETRFDVAVAILTQANLWRQISAMIEDVRLGSKDAVRAAQTVGEKRQMAQIDWSGIESLATS